jgi:hypothetical protein
LCLSGKGLIILRLSSVVSVGVTGGGGSSGDDAWNMGGMKQNLPDEGRKTRSPADFLGAHGNLVNLDQLVAKAPPKGKRALYI